MMIDIHAHLCFPEYEQDREEIVRKCKERMDAVIASSARYDEGECVLGLCASNRGFIFPTIGCHPTEGTNHEGIMQLIGTNQKAVVGVGEVGLDYHWEKDPAKQKTQKEIFSKFIGLAKELGKPLVIHSWDAEKDCFDMVRKSGLDCIFHCYSGSRELAKDILDSGFWISISTQIIFSKNHRKLAKMVPIESMLLETDSPFLSPNKPERNYPWNIELSAEKIAKENGMEASEILLQTAKNAKKVFSLEI